MKRHPYRLLFFLCFFSYSPFFAQTPLLDSLKQELCIPTDDSTRLDRLLYIGRVYNSYQPSQGIPFAEKAWALAKKLNRIDKEAEAHKTWGRLAANNGQMDSALLHFQLARRLTPQFESDEFMLGLLMKFKYVHSSIGNNDSAMYYNIEALKWGEKLNDSVGIANCLNDIADMLASLGNPQEALTYAERALVINKAINHKSNEAYTYQILGVIYRELGELDRALDFQDKSLDLLTQLGAEADYAIGLLYRGNIYKYRTAYTLALADYQKGLELATKIGYPGLIDVFEASLGDIYVRTAQFTKALPYLLRAIERMDKKEMSENLPENFRHVSKAYAGLGQFDSAYHYLVLSYDVRDTIFNQASEETETRMRTEYETQKNLDEIALLKKDAERQRLIIGFALGFLALTIVILFLLERSNRIRTESNRLLSQTNDTLNSQKTEIEKQRDVIEGQNNKNELLLKEIHHRVKNNLQTISSLLNLQSAHIQDASAKEAVQAGQHRVKSMALIHQKLYQRENLAGVEMKDYLTTLGESLLDTFGERAEAVTLAITMDEVELDVDTAVPIGLIVNELITNSLKYAFPDNTTGIISVCLIRNSAQKLELTVSDNGVGKTDNFDSKERTSFGSRLIHLLSLQLNGKVTTDHSNGTSVHLIFEENI